MYAFVDLNVMFACPVVAIVDVYVVRVLCMRLVAELKPDFVCYLLVSGCCQCFGVLPELVPSKKVLHIYFRCSLLWKFLYL